MKIRSYKICIKRLKIFNVPSKVGEEDRSRFDTITIEHCNIVTDIILLEAFSQGILISYDVKYRNLISRFVYQINE